MLFLCVLWFKDLVSVRWSHIGDYGHGHKGLWALVIRGLWAIGHCHKGLKPLIRRELWALVIWNHGHGWNQKFATGGLSLKTPHLTANFGVIPFRLPLFLRALLA